MSATASRMPTVLFMTALLALAVSGCGSGEAPPQSQGDGVGKVAGDATGPTTPGLVADRTAPGRLPVGPYKFIKVGEFDAPWYLVPFDGDGRCEAPETKKRLIEWVKTGKFTDVFIFSHGWNNDWAAANRLYDGWIRGFADLRRANNLEIGRDFRPLFVGIIWPSTALVLPSEQGPGFRSDEPDVDDFVGQERAEVRSLAQGLPEADRARFYDLTQIKVEDEGTTKGAAEEPGLDEDEALELAKILAPMFQGPDEEVGESDIALAAADLVQAWQAAGSQQDLGGFRADLSRLDPRWIVRVATVWQMKSRAGTVGRQGVGSMLDAILASPVSDGQTAPRVHLIGHSYGAKVVLSALCAGVKPRNVNSVLLLQPAISYLCFDPNAAGPGKPGGYFDAPNRCEQPILTTFSACDQPLTKFYHLALRRNTDLGDRGNDVSNVPPSIYAALGGFGPAVPNNGVEVVDYKAAPNRYSLTGNNLKVIGINGSPQGDSCGDGRGIEGHGDVSNPFTYWMLFNQITTP